MTVADRILTATDGGELSLLCLIDMSKCFDTIDHDIFLRRLRLHSVDIPWLSAYLRGHTQSVAFRDRVGRTQTSRPLENNMGVFQGSALGPIILFTVFANDMSLFAEEADVMQFTDDTQVMLSGKKK